MQTEMLIGSKLAKGKGEAEPVINPKTGKSIVKIKEATPDQVDAAVAAADEGFRDVVAHDADAARGADAEARRPHRGGRAGLRRARSAELRQADQRGEERRDAGDRRLPALLRRRGARHPGQRRGGIHAGLHLDGPPRPGRRRRLDHALELPADDGGVEDRPGADGRQHDGAEALGDDAAHDAEARRAHRRDLSGGRVQRRRRARRRPPATR